MAANDNRDKSAPAEKALANLRRHRDDIIRKLADEYDENDAQKRLDKLPKICCGNQSREKSDRGTRGEAKRAA